MGIDYARMICSFLVVCIHFNGFNNILDRSFLLKSMAVPIFMFVSFFLTANVYMELNAIGLKKRMIRLYVPVCVWGGIYFIIRSVLGKKLLIRALLLELLFGNSGENNAVFWFNVVQIYITLLLWCIFCLQKRWDIQTAERVMLVVAIIAFIWQVTGMNDIVFTESLLLEARCTFNRVSGMVLFAVAGFMLSLQKDKIARKGTWTYALMMFIFVNVLSEIFDLSMIRYWQETRIFLCGVTLACFFIFVPLPENKVVSFLSRYSFGVYCMHMLVGELCGGLFGRVNGTVQSSVIYLICIGTAFVLDKCIGKKARVFVC
ncbi:MAG: acyltransferase [Clostridium sp.]|nr:acyltransferase [Clostridium sp.]